MADLHAAYTMAYERLEDANEEIKLLRKERDELGDGRQLFLDRCNDREDLLRRVSEKLHQITKDTDGIWGFLEVHHAGYRGAEYGTILKEIDELLGLEYDDEHMPKV